MLRMICDDQKSELETVQKLLEDYAGEHPDLFLSIRCFSNPLDMLDEMDRSGAPDIALLDICMPGLLGTDIAREIKRKSEDAADIIFLTASADFAVEAFALHVNDYLTKPYAFSELAARIRALLRRHSEEKTDCLSAGDLSLCLSSKRVTRGGREISLSAREFALLESLMRHKGSVLSRAQLENQIWDYGFEGGSNVIDVYIRYLRRKIDDPFEKKLIHTVRGAGYVLREEA